MPEPTATLPALPADWKATPSELLTLVGSVGGDTDLDRLMQRVGAAGALCRDGRIDLAKLGNYNLRDHEAAAEPGEPADSRRRVRGG